MVISMGKNRGLHPVGVNVILLFLIPIKKYGIISLFNESYRPDGGCFSMCKFEGKTAKKEGAT